MTLTGAGGAGKTRLGLQVAAGLTDGTGDGVWFADLAPLGDPGLVAVTVADVLGIRLEPGRPVVETLVEAVGQGSLLVVLDNCEHLIDACAKLADALLRGCPNIYAAIDQREPLGIGGERVYRVPSLGTPADSDDPGAIRASEVVRLLGDRAAAQGVPLAGDEPSAQVAGRICRRLDGIPLAIELAAARLRVMPAAELDARLDARFALLTGGSRVALPHDQMWMDRLDAELGNLRAAIAFSLTQPDPEPGLRLAASLRVYWSARGHATEGADALRALLDAPAARPATLVRAWALAAAADLLQQMGSYEIAGDYCQEGLAIARAAADENLVAELLWQRAWVLLHQGQNGPARPMIESGLGLARRLGEPHLTGRLLGARAHATYEAADHAGAARDAAEALRLFRQAGDRLLVGELLNNLGNYELSGGELDAARRHLAESLDIARALNARSGVVYAAFNLGLAEYLGGSSGAAGALFAESLDLAGRTGGKGPMAYALIGLALAGREEAGPGWSARLHGAADQAFADLSTTPEPLEARLADLDRQRLSAAMGAEAFDAEYAGGRTLDVAHVADDALHRMHAERMGHPDHIAISRLTTQAFRALVRDHNRGQRLYHALFPPRRTSMAEELAHWIIGSGQRATDPAALQAITLFAGESATMRLTRDDVRVEWFPPGTYVVKKDEPAHALYLILSGTADRLVEQPDGQVTHQRPMRTGDFFGEVGLVAGWRPAYVVARDSLTCLVLSRTPITPYAGRGADATGAPELAAAAVPPGTCTVDATSNLHRKLRALTRHRTQYPIVPPMLPHGLMQKMLGTEFFCRIGSSAVSRVAARTPPSAADHRREGHAIAAGQDDAACSRRSAPSASSLTTCPAG